MRHVVWNMFPCTLHYDASFIISCRLCRNYRSANNTRWAVPILCTVRNSDGTFGHA